jgi:hypothetical protein
MRVGSSYARQHLNYRAELCFRAARAAGHPDAENALAALPRTREGLIEAGRGTESAPDTTGHRAPPAPLDQPAAHPTQEGTPPVRTGNPDHTPAHSPAWTGEMRAAPRQA